jgi:hypothetical protein
VLGRLESRRIEIEELGEKLACCQVEGFLSSLGMIIDYLIKVLEEVDIGLEGVEVLQDLVLVGIFIIVDYLAFVVACVLPT